MYVKMTQFNVQSEISIENAVSRDELERFDVTRAQMNNLTPLETFFTAIMCELHLLRVPCHKQWVCSYA